MKRRLSWPIFWALVGVFVVIASVFLIPAARELLMGLAFLIASGTVFFLLGVALIFLTLREKVRGKLKKFFILTGASSAGFFVSFLLHNAIYGLLIYWFGADFWKGGDEPVFFIMATVVCPIGFLVGVAGSIVIAIKEFRRAKKTPPSP
ncbi:hypothetical protein ES703_28124 [subsurface metagenome]